MGDSTQAKPFIEKAESLKNGIKKLKKRRALRGKQ
ncbi:MAG: hypothetical protein IPL63_00065 [Saprospiraceae bacterium]|nr:hypothetical protein [Saprospiraceae bacterium]MBK9045104.1 hypothetical protein [Saprospiraceae bacterium]